MPLGKALHTPWIVERHAMSSPTGGPMWEAGQLCGVARQQAAGAGAVKDRSCGASPVASGWSHGAECRLCATAPPPSSRQARGQRERTRAAQLIRNSTAPAEPRWRRAVKREIAAAASPAASGWSHGAECRLCAPAPPPTSRQARGQRERTRAAPFIRN